VASPVRAKDNDIQGRASVPESRLDGRRQDGRIVMAADGAEVVIVLGTPAAWYWMAAFGCSMATAGCQNFSMPMPWDEPELFGVLGPFFVLRAGMWCVGKWGEGSLDHRPFLVFDSEIKCPM
jgi:hypothetical protein